MARNTYSNRNHYIKDKKITILVNDYNGPEPNGEDWQPLEGGKNIWAYYRQASADEYDRAGLAGYKVEAVFRINWRNNISVDHRILFRGDNYEITRIDDFEGYKKDLTIYVHHIKP